MTPDQKPQLLPCPFCFYEPRLMKARGYKNKVCCSHAECPIFNVGFTQEKWQARNAPPTPAPTDEALSNAIKHAQFLVSDEKDEGYPGWRKTSVGVLRTLIHAALSTPPTISAEDLRKVRDVLQMIVRRGYDSFHDVDKVSKALALLPSESTDSAAGGS